MFEHIEKFEKELANFTGAPYAVTTDCCTHAIELCLILDNIDYCKFSAFTYLSVPMTMHKLGIDYELTGEEWSGEYQFHNTRIWDSARRLQPNMYRKGQLQCLSFGYGKPVSICRGGAILLDCYDSYKKLSAMRYDGRDLSISPWQEQVEFNIGYHYKMNPEESIRASAALSDYIVKNKYDIVQTSYPDCREIKIQ
jgi:dTDP-4-amino-4,6-dideoxygalactose transaminase